MVKGMEQGFPTCRSDSCSSLSVNGLQPPDERRRSGVILDGVAKIPGRAEKYLTLYPNCSHVTNLWCRLYQSTTQA